MARRRNETLDAASVKRLQGTGYYSDGKGLYLRISSSSTKSYVCGQLDGCRVHSPHDLCRSLSQ